MQICVSAFLRVYEDIERVICFEEQHKQDSDENI